MNNRDWINKQRFLYPRSAYRGHFTPSDLVFNANLQEFSQRMSYISGLHTSGKISAQEAYRQAKHLWKQLKQSKKAFFEGLNSEIDDHQ